MESLLKNVAIMTATFLFSFFALAGTNNFDTDSASGEFGGCPDWCDKKFPNGGDEWTQCMRSTYNDGYCGSKPKSNANSDQCPPGPCPGTGKAMEKINGQCTCAPAQNTNQNQQAQCKQRYETLKTACDTSYSDASYSCDEKNDSGMTSVADTASQIALMLGQQTASSVQAACGKMADISQAANGAVAAYRLNCSNSMSSCRSSCTDAKTYFTQNAACITDSNASTQATMLTTASDNIKRCDNFNAKMNQANQAIQNYGATSANASQCASLTSGDPTQQTPFCQANPTYPGCAQAASTDCNNPQVAATSKVCICSKNPTDPTCMGTQNANNGDGVGAGGDIDSSSRMANNNSTDSSAGDIPGLPPIAQGKIDSSSGQPVDGQQGAGAPLSSGGSSGGAAGKSGGSPGAPTAEDPSGGGGGYYGGGAGGMFPGGGGSGGGSNGRGASGTSGVTANTYPKGPDLRKFLPGGQFDPRRGIAGASGPDGITGPHSDIWQKVQNRYRVVSPTLMP